MYVCMYFKHKEGKKDIKSARQDASDHSKPYQLQRIQSSDILWDFSQEIVVEEDDLEVSLPSQRRRESYQKVVPNTLIISKQVQNFLTFYKVFLCMVYFL